jgi:ribosomal protein L40E
MGVFEEFVVKAKDGFDVAAKKTGEIISVQKLRLSIASIKSEISKNYEAIGRLQYESVKNGVDNAEAIASLADSVEQKLAEIENIEGQIAECTNKKNCPVCGAKNENNAAFCNKCGEKL